MNKRKKITPFLCALSLLTALSVGCSDTNHRPSDVLDSIDSNSSLASLENIDLSDAISTKPKGLELTNVKEVEIYDSVTLEDIVSTKDVKLKNGDAILDTSSLGSKKTDICYEFKGQLYAHPLEYTVTDTTPPLLLNAGGGATILQGEKFELDKMIGYADNADPKPTLTYEGSVNTSVCGSYPITYTITDASGNTTQHDIEINVIEEYPEYDEETEEETIPLKDIMDTNGGDKVSFGVDVSRWQEDIDFEAVKKSGCEFAIIRLGYYDFEYTLDSYFKQNIKAAKEAGLKVGVYIYTMANTEEEIKENTKWLNEQLDGEELDLPVVFDWEEFSNFQEFEMSIHDLNGLYELFDKEMQSYGYSTMLYSSKNFLDNFWYSHEEHPVWLAHYTDETDYSGDYVMWQMCSNGSVDGIEGGCDVDILYKDRMEKFE